MAGQLKSANKKTIGNNAPMVFSFEQPKQVRSERQHNTDDDASDNRKVKLYVFFLDNNVTW